jgi:hypothetical protein
MATKTRRPWDNDAVSGGKSSLDVLLDWLTNGSNYMRWKGGASGGTTKEKMCSDVVALLRNQEILHRTNRDIRNKIGELERSYRSATDWLAKTGQGIQEEDTSTGSNTIQAYVTKICKFYDILHPIMRDRPSARPLFTNEKRENDHEEDEWVPSEAFITEEDSAESSTSTTLQSVTPRHSMSAVITSSSQPSEGVLLNSKPSIKTTRTPTKKTVNKASFKRFSISKHRPMNLSKNDLMLRLNFIASRSVSLRLRWKRLDSTCKRNALN